MDDISKAEFERMKKNAEERMMQMKKEGLPFPDFVSIPRREEQRAESPTTPAAETVTLAASESSPRTSSASALPTSASQKRVYADERHGGKGFLPFLRYLNIPEVTENPDGILLLALILLLSHEGADSTLILALAYILL